MPVLRGSELEPGWFLGRQHWSGFQKDGVGTRIRWKSLLSVTSAKAGVDKELTCLPRLPAKNSPAASWAFSH